MLDLHKLNGLLSDSFDVIDPGRVGKRTRTKIENTHKDQSSPKNNANKYSIIRRTSDDDWHGTVRDHQNTCGFYDKFSDKMYSNQNQ